MGTNKMIVLTHSCPEFTQTKDVSVGQKFYTAPIPDVRPITPRLPSQLQSAIALPQEHSAQTRDKNSHDNSPARWSEKSKYSKASVERVEGKGISRPAVKKRRGLLHELVDGFGMCCSPILTRAPNDVVERYSAEPNQ